ncbi:MAG: ribosomal RNA small subunit methyltransferase E [Nitrospirales bacterium]|nr:MAG: ribosomal RNA small subunit methyltransferase E [Nitrospirales bacterium]
MVKSLRIRPGQIVNVCDERRQRHTIRITNITKKTLSADIQETVFGPPQTPPVITLAQSVLKGEHMAWAIQKSTELGVHIIAPIITERVQSRSGSRSFNAHHERWQRIALEAAQQSERWDYPTLLPSQTFSEFLERVSDTHIKLIFTEREHAKDVNGRACSLEPHMLATQNILLAIGPEGGWSQAELQKAEMANMTKVTLGEHILRSETAAIAGLLLLQERLERFTFTTVTRDPHECE